MAMIDSGLGWKCDSDYYVSAADTVLNQYDVSGFPLVKANTGAAMCAVIMYSRGQVYIVSTVETNVAIHLSVSSNNYPIYSTTYNGKTWYISTSALMNSTYTGSRPRIDPSDVPNFGRGELTNDQTRQAIVKAIVEAANTEFYKVIPSTDYVKAFVEGVEAETATRVNANKASIGTLSSLTTTDKSSLVAAINEINARLNGQ